MERATLHTVDERPMLRLERKLAHPPEKVWRAITDPAELKHWFPAAVKTELKAGAPIEFTFEGQDSSSAGEVLECDPPSLFSFSWNEDVLRWEISPDGDGSRLLFTHTFGRGEPAIAALAAGRNAAGWDVCLAALEARLDGKTAEPPADWLTPMAAYVREFGLDAGEVVDGVLRFSRDLVWTPLDEVWNLLTSGELIEIGEIVTSEAPKVLEYRAGPGIVRWEFTHDPLDGTRVEVTQTGVPDAERPAALAAWRARLDLFFAATHERTAK
ncbi:SRPBCC family protein [Amycolatopsis sp. NPDC059657]|uniref:SRPBCC family protein n=1 Tax=Amycolatopsis sp. NPDC059657 TaxID=3346899 RepID=UPI0036705A96